MLTVHHALEEVECNMNKILYTSILMIPFKTNGCITAYDIGGLIASYGI